MPMNRDAERRRYANDPIFRKVRQDRDWKRKKKQRSDPHVRAEYNAQRRVYAQAIHARYHEMVRSAKRRKLPCTISEAEYCELISDNRCAYGCGTQLPVSGIGLDRIKSSGGYTKDNVVPCCSFCNWTRGHDLISYEEMFRVVALLREIRKTPEGESSWAGAIMKLGPESPQVHGSSCP